MAFGAMRGWDLLLSGPEVPYFECSIALSIIRDKFIREPLLHDDRALGTVKLVSNFFEAKRCVKAFCRD